jgi:tetratricopeptide (TPR) repeat protein
MKNFMKFLSALFLLCVSSSVFAFSDSSQHYYNLGKQAFTEKKYMVAEKNFNKSLKFDSTNTTTLLELATTYTEMKKYSNAIMQYKRVEKIDVNNAIAIENLATLSFMFRNWNESITYGQKCIDKNIGKGMNYRVAKAYFNNEDYMTASKYLQKASVEEPTNADVPYTMANIWLEMSNGKKAVEMFEIALKMDSTNAQWYYELGALYQDLGDVKKSTYCYEKSNALNPSSDLASMTTLGLSYLNNGQYDKGVALMEKVIAKKPMDKTIYNDMGYAFYNNKKYAEAIKYWDEILRIDKQDARTLYMIGIAFRKSGDETKGNRLCDAAIAMDPQLGSLKKEMMPPQGMGL